MSMTIRYELQLLFASLTVGICLMMVYDGLRVFRTLVPHGNFWTGIEDAVYWAASSITTFLLLFRQNDGILRWYAILGVLMGMLVYNLTVSRILLRLLKKVEKYLTIRKIKRQKIRQKRLEEEEKRRLLEEQKRQEKKEQKLRLREEKEEQKRRLREEKEQKQLRLREKKEEKQKKRQKEKQHSLTEDQGPESRRSRKAEEKKDAGKRKGEKKKERKSE
ncbi:spore cortex biosynthesis protein YabQ [[Clostridium] symbiosum]|uniref:spore cortex biosynthesis protein YabQ n=1 Tax=Clostridium symbiosum TaxID=1512 RepID=UPI001D08CE69|nr:spore cortex biosynthesis protein YabQ [[Clostridium] symbiosum]MCB6609620.1 spore cortex biosynthesis protein YabQ [[Clostridium] symbiosum]MCB6933138.1 spore cortex biosynthesis protein YabQ [[Clostridium] symbiosum]